ncbi:MAG: hypothetical protein IJR99_17175 [Kiritimatiellae bacterium]|nr:hypothetical protein [Kiritimatiellia bacterium]
MTKEQVWKQAWERVRAIDAALESGRDVSRELTAVATWFREQRDQPRLVSLANLLTSPLTRRQLWCVLVPLEREIARLKITDVEILEGDRPAPVADASSRMAVTVVLDSIRSAFNVGGIFRTAECFGVERLVLCGYTATPEDPAIVRSALGTERLVEWQAEADIQTAISRLRETGIACYALETVSGAEEIGRVQWRFPLALVVGNERFGITHSVLSLCDGIVRIPLYGCKNSLNVVTSFAIAAHTLRRAWGAGALRQRGRLTPPAERLRSGEAERLRS